MDNKYIKPELKVVLFTKDDVFTEALTSPESNHEYGEGEIIQDD